MKYKVFFTKRRVIDQNRSRDEQGWFWVVENEKGKIVASSIRFRTQEAARDAYKGIAHIFGAEEGTAMTHEFLSHTLEHGGWNEAEYIAIRWHFDQLPEFDSRLMNAITVASQAERTKIREVFPHHVVAYLSWKRGDLQERLHKALVQYEKRAGTEDRQGAGATGRG
jgi:hypothetical protein